MIQFLEGYWGISPLAVRLASSRIRLYRRTVNRLECLADLAQDSLEEAGHLNPRFPVPEREIDLLWIWNEADRLRASYPLRLQPHHADQARQRAAALRDVRR
jgi:hypothetical protein